MRGIQKLKREIESYSCREVGDFYDEVGVIHIFLACLETIQENQEVIGWDNLKSHFGEKQQLFLTNLKEQLEIK